MLTITTNPHFRPEKEYAFQVVLGELLGVGYELRFAETTQHQLSLPNGAILAFPDHFGTLVTPSRVAALFKGFHRALVEPNLQRFDVFLFTFFMLSRLEETLGTERDRHGRFLAEKSLACQEGFLDRPIVNECADEIWRLLVKNGWAGKQKKRAFRMMLSCDVDRPKCWWSVADWVKSLAGALFKRSDWQEASFLLRQYMGAKTDPHDVFDGWLDFFDRHKLQVQFNFMGERATDSDSWYPLRHPFVLHLMEKLVTRGHAIGFHPSYESFDDEELFGRELESLRQASPVEVTSGRQHYLRFDVPRTWQIWDAAGLKEDSTLGYAEAEGFRCGICQDFPVFDLRQRRVLSLRETPLIAMDVTLAFYRKYSPSQAAERLDELLSHVKRHGGDFTLLWHNSSWSLPFWQPWQAVFYNFLLK